MIEIFSWYDFLNEAKKAKKRNRKKYYPKSDNNKVINNFYSNPYTNLYPKNTNNTNISDDEVIQSYNYIKPFNSFER